MANSVDALKPEYWAGEIQKSLFVENTAVFLANTRFVNLVAGDGDTVNYASLSYPSTATYTPGSDVSYTNLSATNEQLSIATFLTQNVRIDDTEIRQAKYGIREATQERMLQGLRNKVEQKFLAEATNAVHSIDDGNVAGTSGNNIVVTTENAPLMFTAASNKLSLVDAPMSDRYAVIGPRTYNQVLQYRGGRPTNLGDVVSQNGLAGQAFGWNIVVNNNLKTTAVLSLVTQPTNNDTITVCGVVTTFKTTLTNGGTAECYVVTDVDTTRANLNKLFNQSGTEGTDYNTWSAENKFLLLEKRGITSANDNSADTLTLTGYGDITVSKSLTDPTDNWTSNRQDALFLTRGAVDIAVQIPPFVEKVRDNDQFAWVIRALLGMGVKTFADGARQMVRVKVNALGSASGNSHWN